MAADTILHLGLEQYGLDDDQGVARRAGFDLKYIHVAQVLNDGPF